MTRKNRDKRAARARQRTHAETYLQALATIRDDARNEPIVAGEDDPVMVPWQCGESPSRCQTQWHLSQWITVPEPLVDSYLDGDWELADVADVPTWSDVDAAWQSYAEHVVVTGDDPLGEFTVTDSDDVTQCWTFLVGDCDGGITLRDAHVTGEPPWDGPLPQVVRDFLLLRDDGTLDVEWANTRDMAVGLTTIPSGDADVRVDAVGDGVLTGRFSVTVRRPRDPEAVRDERRRAAASTRTAT